jgi:hypothetical protein
MGYKVFTAGEEALASDVNSLLMSQTVARFATAAARSTALTAPVLNQMSALDNRPGVIQFWTGSVWADIDYSIQIGRSNLTTDASGNASITFPYGFAANPVVTVMADVTASGPQAVPAMVALSPTYIVLKFSVGATTVGAGFTTNVSWIAVGAKP